MDSPSHPINEQLQQARERAGLSIDDVHFKTRLPKSVLLALEAGDFEIFSSPTYARSFLTQYSEYLGVDASEWAAALRPGPFVSNEFIHPWIEESAPAPKIRMSTERSSPAWLSAACVLFLSGGVIFAAMKGYDYLETRFGDEVHIPEVVTGAKSETSMPQNEPLQAEVSPRNDEGNPLVPGTAFESAPRAIVVRQ